MGGEAGNVELRLTCARRTASGATRERRVVSGRCEGRFVMFKDHNEANLPFWEKPDRAGWYVQRCGVLCRVELSVSRGNVEDIFLITS